ncbi:MAG: leucyl/phenylalanyl-tRNA--protein transferase [Actinomycetota bacterium]|nr:leucyl/phenylalanyl-tRNA--protein transferase [Euzebyales bacterium]MDQ3342325.1 leucyl/phenylalanyl-tRNA--protein transferase [Actinomycetota bacterium]MDQ3528589.1 leucyl/phenylalanyl-tRNA--protein transferase [Actinomycetota bacterium]
MVRQQDSASRFPAPGQAPADGPLAWGNDLRVATLLDAYRHGIFPWPVADGTVYWWSPDPRALIPLDGVHVSRSLRRMLRSPQLRCTRDAAFPAVVTACATGRDTGTWIVPQLIDAYRRLHAAGFAHSVEVWSGPQLIGGVFGIAVGGAFTGESMFHRRPDASKVALFSLAAHLRDRGFALLDAQLPTEHLTSMGAVAVPRAAFLRRLAVTVDAPVTF